MGHRAWTSALITRRGVASKTQMYDSVWRRLACVQSITRLPWVCAATTQHFHFTSRRSTSTTTTTDNCFHRSFRRRHHDSTQAESGVQSQHNTASQRHCWGTNRQSRLGLPTPRTIDRIWTRFSQRFRHAMRQFERCCRWSHSITAWRDYCINIRTLIMYTVMKCIKHSRRRVAVRWTCCVCHSDICTSLPLRSFACWLTGNVRAHVLFDYYHLRVVIQHFVLEFVTSRDMEPFLTGERRKCTPEVGV